MVKLKHLLRCGLKPTAMLAFIAFVLGAITACLPDIQCEHEDCMYTVYKPLPSDSTSSATRDSYIGPPIIGKARVLYGESTASWQPALRDEFEVLQFVSGMSATAYRGLIYTRLAAPATPDSLLPDPYPASATAAASLSVSAIVTSANGTFIAAAIPGLLRIPKGDSVAGEAEGYRYEYALADDGSVCLGARRVTRDQLAVILYNSATGDTTQLFARNIDPSGWEWGANAREVHVAIEPNGHRIIYGLIDRFQENVDGSPAWSFRYNLTTNELEWLNIYEITTPQEAAQKLLVEGDLVLHKGWHRVIAYDRATGRERWRYDHGTISNIGTSPLIGGGGRVYFFEELTGLLLGLDLADGRLVYRDRTAAPSVVRAERWTRDRWVFVSMGDSHLNLFDAATGTYVVRWLSPEHNLTTGQRQFNWDGFAAYPDRGIVIAQDREKVWAFDLSEY